MASGKKLINKLKRRERYAKEQTEQTVNINKQEETMQATPGVYELMRGVQRRMDESFGYDTVKHEPMLEYKVAVATTERYDFDPGAGTSYGIRLTLAAGLIEAIGVLPGDTVEIREQGSALEGRMLTVVDVVDSTHLRLDDVSTFTGPESNNYCRFLISAVKKSYV